MPVEFDSIRTEHAAVREDVGSSTSRTWAQIHVCGPGRDGVDATPDVERCLFGSRLATPQYAAITDEEGSSSTTPSSIGSR